MSDAANGEVAPHQDELGGRGESWAEAHPRRARPADPAVRHRAGHGPRGRRGAAPVLSGRSSRPAGSGSRRSRTTSAWPGSPPGPPRSSRSRWPGAPASTRRWCEQMAVQIGASMRAVGVHQGLAPVLDVTVDPRWGRTEETIGEDPYLVATVGTAYVRGPGVDRAHLHAQALRRLLGLPRRPEPGAAAVTGRQLADLLLPPFEMAIRLGGARSVMHAYTDIDGIPTASDPYLLSDVLRDDLGLHRDGGGRLLRHQLPGAAARRGRRSGPGGRAGAGRRSRRRAAHRPVLRRAAHRARSNAGRWPRRWSTGPRAGSCCRSANWACSTRPGTRTRPARPGLTWTRRRPGSIAAQLAEESIVLLANDGTLPLSGRWPDRRRRPAGRRPARHAGLLLLPEPRRGASTRTWTSAWRSRPSWPRCARSCRTATSAIHAGLRSRRSRPVRHRGGRGAGRRQRHLHRGGGRPVRPVRPRHVG